MLCDPSDYCMSHLDIRESSVERYVPRAVQERSDADIEKESTVHRVGSVFPLLMCTICSRCRASKLALFDVRSCCGNFQLDDLSLNN